MAAKAKRKPASKMNLPKRIRDTSSRSAPADDSGLGTEVEMELPDALGGGGNLQPVPIPPGRYLIARGAVAWLIKRTEFGEYEALYPIQMLVELEVLHEVRMRRRVRWGPENVEWTVIEIDGIPMLARPGDLSVCSNSELLDV